MQSFSVQTKELHEYVLFVDVHTMDLCLTFVVTDFSFDIVFPSAFGRNMTWRKQWNRMQAKCSLA